LVDERRPLTANSHGGGEEQQKRKRKKGDTWDENDTYFTN